MACVEAVRGTKNSHWISKESVLLCVCWGNVSGELTGPGISQNMTHLWNKITDLYQTSNPPPLQDKAGNLTGEIRQKSALYNKWGRMGPFISEYMSCLSIAEANVRSGESTAQTQKRAVDQYNIGKKKPWSLQKEYEALEHLPKWLLDRVGHKNQAERTDGTTLAAPVQEALTRMRAEAPTVANTGKPVGIKKARRNVREMKVVEEERVDEAKKLKEFMETFIKSAAQTDRALQLEMQKNEELAATTDALILFAEVENLSQESAAIIQASKIVAKQRMVERCRVAGVVAAVLEAEREAEELTQLNGGSLV